MEQFILLFCLPQAIFEEIGVNMVLYFLVFGESLLNDGVSVVVYNTMITLSSQEHIGADQVRDSTIQFPHKKNQPNSLDLKPVN